MEVGEFDGVPACWEVFEEDGCDSDGSNSGHCQGEVFSAGLQESTCGKGVDCT
ncbi:hypothetical protein A2U01_0077822, partial [Trifolium medium]|nr:hypothetical protein [Trifolium medium]